MPPEATIERSKFEKLRGRISESEDQARAAHDYPRLLLHKIESVASKYKIDPRYCQALRIKVFTSNFGNML